MNFVKASVPFNINDNFWEMNPFVRFISPFNKLYEIENSSHYAWAMWMMCDPDETENTLYRQPPEIRKETISRIYPDIDWDNEIFNECMDAYPFECMNAVERALLEEKESLRERAKLIRDTPYTLDETKVTLGKDGSEKAIVIKGTATQLDAMRTKSKKIYEDLEELLAKFTAQKSTSAKVKGGRDETPTEKGLI
jgi:hypothetical protein